MESEKVWKNQGKGVKINEEQNIRFSLKNNMQPTCKSTMLTIDEIFPQLKFKH